MRSVFDARRMPTTGAIALAASLFAVAVLTLNAVEFSYAVQHALLMSAIFGIAATGWGLFAGFGGQFSFGHAALFGLPAYVAFLASDKYGISPLVAAVAGAAAVSVASLLIAGPALRLRGPYFALATLALAEIARQWVNDRRNLTGGEDGKLIPYRSNGLHNLSAPGEHSYLVWAGGLLVITVACCWLFLRSRHGRELQAVRDDQDIAETSGINSTKVKLLAFVISAFFTGLAGCLYASSTHIVASDALLDPGVSIAILIYATVGGVRSVFGPALGAFFLVGVQEWFRVGLGADQPNLYRIFYAIVFALILYFAPGGVVGLVATLLGGVRRRVHTMRSRRPDVGARANGGGKAAAAGISSEDVASLLDDLAPLERSGPAGGGPAPLVVAGLTKRFGAVVVNDSIGFELAGGGSLAIWGHNGSGKSTLVNLLGGQLAADGGPIRLGDHRVDRLSPYRRSRRGVVRASQQARLYDAQTVLDNLLVTVFSTKRLHPLVGRDFSKAVALATRALDATALPREALHRPAGALSTGQRKRVEIARLLLGHRPRLILMDEPTAGIDRAGVPVMASVLRALQEGTGASLIVVDHDQDFLFSVATRVLCLAGGRVVDEIATDEPGASERLERSLVTTGAQ